MMTDLEAQRGDTVTEEDTQQTTTMADQEVQGGTVTEEDTQLVRDFFCLPDKEGEQNLDFLRKYENFRAPAPGAVMSEYRTTSPDRTWVHLIIFPEYLPFFFLDPSIEYFSICLGHEKDNQGSVMYKYMLALVRLQNVEEWRRLFQRIQSEIRYPQRPTLKEVNDDQHLIDILNFHCCRTGMDENGKDLTHFSRRIYNENWIHDKEDKGLMRRKIAFAAENHWIDLLRSRSFTRPV